MKIWFPISLGVNKSFGALSNSVVFCCRFAYENVHHTETPRRLASVGGTEEVAFGLDDIMIDDDDILDDDDDDVFMDTTMSDTEQFDVYDGVGGKCYKSGSVSSARNDVLLWTH